MGYRNALFAIVALALSSAALAGVLYTDAYAHAARNEARGLQALTEQLQGGTLLCDADSAARHDVTLAAPALLSSAAPATVQR